MAPSIGTLLKAVLILIGSVTHLFYCTKNEVYIKDSFS